MTEIKGWEMELGELQLKIEEYKQRSDSARRKVENVKKSVAEQKQLLISEFSQGVQIFAESAKIRLKLEIDKVAQNQSKKPSSSDNEDKTLFSQLWGKFSSLFEKNSSPDPYKIRCKDKKEAQKLARTINEYCTPVIHSFWLDTQDKLIREGTRIREGIVERIKEDIQAISDELSEYIGNALQVDISTNPIQFPNFEFSGIDAMIKEQQKVFARIKKEKRTKKGNCCKPDKVYYVDVPYEEKVSYYEVDLLLTLQQIENKIDEQVNSNLELLERLIQKQVKEDFSQGEKQIKDYINRFQSEFDQLLKQRATREVEAPEIVAKLEIQKAEIIKYLIDLNSIRELLDSRKPITR
ncbi:hypothetical protein ACE1B6_20755 [Aerosakkonemataceae cyanobacterium BLCC-F154]|uniref:Uncharacterized protein n=1 Tax=Floridaenema fluviatile BLCC-F154 TaxID=3153640 RepID=A0ABV4YFU3_9CYAN